LGYQQLTSSLLCELDSHMGKLLMRCYSGGKYANICTFCCDPKLILITNSGPNNIKKPRDDIIICLEILTSFILSAY